MPGNGVFVLFRFLRHICPAGLCDKKQQSSRTASKYSFVAYSSFTHDRLVHPCHFQGVQSLSSPYPTCERDSGGRNETQFVSIRFCNLSDDRVLNVYKREKEETGRTVPGEDLEKQKQGYEGQHPNCSSNHHECRKNGWNTGFVSAFGLCFVEWK